MDQASRVMIRHILSEAAGSTIFARGISYARDDLAQVTSSRQDEELLSLEGIVYGSDEYETSLLIDLHSEDLESYECSCPYEDVCKHVVALGITYIDTKSANAASRIIPPAATDVLGDIRDRLRALNIDPDLLSADALRELSQASSKLSGPRVVVPQPSTTSRGEWQKSGRTWTQKESVEEAHQSPKKPKPPRPFHQRYELAIGLIYDGSISRPHLQRKTKQTYHYWYSEPTLKAKDLLHEETELSPPQKEFLSLMKVYESAKPRAGEYEAPCDLAAIVSAAHRADIGIVTSDGSYGKTIPLEWREPTPLEARLSVQSRISDEYNTYYHSYPYEVTTLEVPRFEHEHTDYVHGGQSGLVIASKTTLEVHQFPEAAALLLARAIRASYRPKYGGPFDRFGKPIPLHACTDLISIEYMQINEIQSQLAAACTFSSSLPTPLTVRQYQGKPVIIVDYDQEKTTLAVVPSVEYGSVLLPVSDTLYRSLNKKKELLRRAIPAFGTTHVVRISGSEIHIAPVSFKGEEELFLLGETRGAELGLTKKSRAIFKGERQVERCVLEYLPRIKTLPYEIRYIRDIPAIETAEFRAHFNIESDIANDWLAFDLELYCGDERVQLADIESFLEDGGSFLKMKDGRLLKITNPETIRRLLDLLAHFRKDKKGSYEGHAYHAPGLSAMAQSSKHYTSRLSDDLKTFLQQARTGRAVSKIHIPAPFSKTLRTYQQDGVHWMHFLKQYRFGGILADDMGLGKTIQALAMMSMHAAERSPSIVIAPKTLLHNWEHEVETFAPNLKMLVIDGPEAERREKIMRIRSADLVLTSYSSLQRDIELYEKLKKPFTYCIIDEAQNIKNPRTKSAHAVKRVPSEYRLALTGTPLENNVEELWSIFDFLMPGFLGAHAHFQRHFGHPIMKRSDAVALDHLKARVGAFMLRRTKDEVLKELPAKIEQVIECDLSDDQNILYQDVLRRVRSDIEGVVKKKGFASSQIHILAGLTRLRQICNHPALVLPKKSGAAYPSVKLDACMELVKSLHSERRKVLVFSQFTGMLDILAQALGDEKIGYGYLSGKTVDRKGVVESFTKDAKKTVFLISTKTGGTGLNLTAADAVIIFDPWWNPQVERQAVDRAHRIGQTKTVNVYRLRTKGTIEEKIAALQDRKAKLFGALVGESKDLFQKLTWEEVRGLLS